MTLLIDSAVNYFRRQKMGFIGGNMCVYYSLTQALNADFLGPDFFYVKDADPTKPRAKWEVWNENNRFPNVIIELLSPTTTANDLGSKKDIYEQTFQTPEYLAYDPTEKTLLGWRLSPLTNLYEPLEANDDGRLFSEELNLWIGTWQGTIERQKTTWLRFFHADGGYVLRSDEEERVQKLEERRAKLEERQAKEDERQAKEDERQLKEDALKLAASERAAKEAALAEVERLRKLLESK